MILERRFSSFYRSNVSVYWGQQPIVNSESLIYIELNARGSGRDKYGACSQCVSSCIETISIYFCMFKWFFKGFLLPHYEKE